MADFFSFLSDTDDSAVDDLISQVQDLCVLEQVSAINCSGFTDSELPSDLESRFRKLKSFPLANPKSSSTFLSSSASRSTDELDQNDVTRTEFEAMSDEDDRVFSPSDRNSEGKRGANRESGFLSKSSLVDSSNFSARKGKVTPMKEDSDQKKKSKCAKISSPSLSSTSSRESDGSSSVAKSKMEGKKSSFTSPSNSSSSPLRKLGSFWRSLKKSLLKKKKENNETLPGHGRDTNYDEFLADLEFFSTKKQQKLLKKALKEEQKISREAEKIVKWAKQKSARMSFSAIEDELSDTEISK